MKRIVSWLLASSLLLLLAFSLTAQKNTKHRVVVEVNVAGPDAWNGILNNIENLGKAFAPDEVQIESVSHGKGLGLLLKTNTAMRERLEQAAARGVVFAACQNTMRHQHVTKEDLFPFVITVDSGVAEVVRKQEAGWSYLKTGE
jgi:intracellular sulfur oxidation DsrE/DsrF family protein